jgi:copper chaperone
MNSVTFKVEGMHCGGCAETIQTLLERHAGVRKASASFDKREAQVLYEPRIVSEEQLAAAIDKAGFRVADRRSRS